MHNRAQRWWIVLGCLWLTALFGRTLHTVSFAMPIKEEGLSHAVVLSFPQMTAATGSEVAIPLSIDPPDHRPHNFWGIRAAS